MWTDFPDSADSVSVYVYKTFAPFLKTQESICRFVYIEGAYVHASGETACGIGADRLNGCVAVRFVTLIFILNVIYLPVFELACKMISVAVFSHSHIVSDSFEILYCSSEIDSPHCLNENVKS